MGGGGRKVVVEKTNQTPRKKTLFKNKPTSMFLAFRGSVFEGIEME